MVTSQSKPVASEAVAVMVRSKRKDGDPVPSQKLLLARLRPVAPQNMAN
jgi:hypothetical protein